MHIAVNYCPTQRHGSWDLMSSMWSPSQRLWLAFLCKEQLTSIGFYTYFSVIFSINTETSIEPDGLTNPHQTPSFPLKILYHFMLMFPILNPELLRILISAYLFLSVILHCISFYIVYLLYHMALSHGLDTLSATEQKQWVCIRPVP